MLKKSLFYNVSFIFLLSTIVVQSQISQQVVQPIPLAMPDATTVQLLEGATIALFSPEGYCIGLVGKDGAYVQSFAPGLWATATETNVYDKRMRFVVTKYVGEDGQIYVGFKSEFNGNFLQVVPKGGALASDYVIRAADHVFATESKPWAQFILDPVGDGKFYLQSRATGGYVRLLEGRLLRIATTVTGPLAQRIDATPWTLSPLALSPQQVTRLPGLKGADLAPLIPVLTPVQMGVLTPEQLVSLPANQIAGLFQNQITLITSTQLSRLFALHNLSQEQQASLIALIQIIPEAQLAPLLPMLAPSQVTMVFAGLTASQIGLLKAAQLTRVTSEVLATLPADKKAAITAIQQPVVTPKVVAQAAQISVFTQQPQPVPMQIQATPSFAMAQPQVSVTSQKTIVPVPQVVQPKVQALPVAQPIVQKPTSTQVITAPRSTTPSFQAPIAPKQVVALGVQKVQPISTQIATIPQNVIAPLQVSVAPQQAVVPGVQMVPPQAQELPALQPAPAQVLAAPAAAPSVPRIPEAPQKEETPQSANIPSDFILEGGTAQDVTVGSKDGELKAYVLGLDGQMYMYEADTKSAVPWIKQVAVDKKNSPIRAFKDISMSSDGGLCALSDNGKAYIYSWQQKQFQEIPGGVGNENLLFDKIAIGNVNNIWAVNQESKNIYRLGEKGWELRAADAGVFVAAGFDGTVMGIADNGDVFKYDQANNGWIAYPGVKMSSIAVGSYDYIYGIYKNERLYELWQLMNNSWRRIKLAEKGIDEIAVNAAGTLFAIDYAGNIYNKGNLGLAVTSPSATNVTEAITSVGVLRSDPVVVDTTTNKPATSVSMAMQARQTAKITGKIAAVNKKVIELTKRVKLKAPSAKKATDSNIKKPALAPRLAVAKTNVGSGSQPSLAQARARLEAMKIARKQ